jgi:hypothetical protein
MRGNQQGDNEEETEAYSEQTTDDIWLTVKIGNSNKRKVKDKCRSLR